MLHLIGISSDSYTDKGIVEACTESTNDRTSSSEGHALTNGAIPAAYW